jgi:hypothetical protein
MRALPYTASVMEVFCRYRGHIKVPVVIQGYTAGNYLSV